MPELEWLEPESLDEACRLLAEGDPEVRAVGGATALGTIVKRRLLPLRRLVVLRRLAPELARIEVEPDGTLRIGALVRLRALERDGRVPAVIRGALPRLANVRVRNVATVGGSLCHGDPRLDLPGICVALGGSVVAVSRRGRRQIPLDEFFRGYYETALADDELLAELRLRPLPPGQAAAYDKFTALSAEDWPLAGVTAVVGPGQARLVVGAVGDRPLALSGDDPAAAAAAVDPPDDLHGSAAYKRAIVAHCAGRALERARKELTA